MHEWDNLQKDKEENYKKVASNKNIEKEKKKFDK